MISYKTLSNLIGIGVIATVALVGAIRFFQPPDMDSRTSLVQMMAPIICLLIMWAVAALIERRRPLSGFSKNERNLYTGGLLLGGGILIMSLTLRLLEGVDIFGGEGPDRIRGAVTGGVLMIFGNLMPKALPPLTAFKHAYKPVLSCMRFAGTGLFFAGGGFALAWLALPIEYANNSAMIWCFIVVCIVLVRTALSVLNITAIERVDRQGR